MHPVVSGEHHVAATARARASTLRRPGREWLDSDDAPEQCAADRAARHTRRRCGDVLQEPARCRSPRVAALLLIIDIDPTRPVRIEPDLVAATLGLTPAESVVAALLAEGRTIRDIARATGREENTVRWHKKHVFSRVGVSRQVDLVRLVLFACRHSTGSALRARHRTRHLDEGVCRDWSNRLAISAVSPWRGPRPRTTEIPPPPSHGCPRRRNAPTRS